MGRMLKDQLALAVSAEELDASLDDSSATTQY
jgi:hypothetical protein